MNKSRLFEVFDAIPQKEIKELRKFIKSPFFNQRQHVLLLFEYLVTTKFEQKEQPDRVLAFEYLFPGKPFDDHKLRLSISLLLKCIEKYLAVNEFLQHDNNVQLNLSIAYRELNIPRQFNKTIVGIDAKLKSQSIRNADYYRQRYQFFEEQYLFNKEKSRMAEDLKLKEVHENLDISYIASKLRQSCFSLAHQAIYKKEYDYGMLEDVLYYVDENKFFNVVAIEMYYYCYKALNNRDDVASFEKFKDLMITYQSKFPPGEIRDLFLLATNYCIQQMNRGSKEFAKKGLDIYKVGLKNEVLLLNGILSRYTYGNIVAKALVTKEYEWAEQFLNQYKNKLEKKFQESIFSFNLAWLEYERQHYLEALELINKTKFKDVLLNLSAKTIAMKIYFELQSFDLLYSHLEAMKTFIQRKKVIGYHRKNYLNTIKFMKKILDTPKEDAGLKKQVYNKINATSSVAEKAWLLKQMN